MAAQRRRLVRHGGRRPEAFRGGSRGPPPRSMGIRRDGRLGRAAQAAAIGLAGLRRMQVGALPRSLLAFGSLATLGGAGV